MSQFTKMLEPSPPKNYEQTESGRLILLPVAFPAKMYHAPALEKALKTAMDKLLGQGCGENTQEALVTLDQNGLWRKMCEGCCQQVLISDREGTSELFSGTWPTWGLMRSGRVTALKPLGRPTKGKESLLWPTVTAVEGKLGGKIGKNDTFFTTTVKMWRTPDANLGARGPKSAEMYEECKRTHKHAINLLDQVKHECNWPPPEEKIKGQLNADWVELLMGLPIGWTNLDKQNKELSEQQGWPAPMTTNRQWATPNCMDMLPSRSYEAMKRQATGARKNRTAPGNLREQIDPLMRKAYFEASKENGGKLKEEIRISGQYSYEPPRSIEGQKNRAKRLKCLGNGCVPLQVYPIFKIIMEIEKV